MYATFGDKEALFWLAIARYAEGPAAYAREALEQPTVRAVVEALLRGALELLTDPSHPRGCLSVQGALACGSHAERMKQAMIEWRRQGESHIRKRLQRARREGDLAKDVDPGDLARYISTVLTGLAVQAANGSTRAEMTRLVDIILRSMPVLAIHEALERLEALDPRKARIVELVFFGGLEQDLAAVALHISPATLRRDLRLARAWLYNELRQLEKGSDTQPVGTPSKRC